MFTAVYVAVLHFWWRIFVVPKPDNYVSPSLLLLKTFSWLTRANNWKYYWHAKSGHNQLSKLQKSDIGKEKISSHNICRRWLPHSSCFWYLIYFIRISAILLRLITFYRSGSAVLWIAFTRCLTNYLPSLSTMAPARWRLALLRMMPQGRHL